MISIEWAILVRGISHDIEHSSNPNDYLQMFRIDIVDLIDADFAAAAILISMGGVLGKLNHTQMFFMCIIEVVVYFINMYIGIDLMHVVDMGGSI